MKALRGGTVVDPEAAGAGVKVASVLWDGDGIVEAREPLDTGGADEVLDAEGCIVLPGFVCASTELARSLLPGLPPRAGEGEDERLRRYLDALGPDGLATAVRAAAVEAVRAGVTVVFDVWRGSWVDGALDVIARALEEVGLRGVLGADVSEARGVDAARAAVRENVRFHKRVETGNRFRGAMAVNDPDTLEAVLLEAASEARKAEMPSHVVFGGTAESRRRLLERGMLRPGSLAVVASAMDDEERALLRDLHVWTATRARADAARAVPPPPLRGLHTRTALGGGGPDADVLAERDALVHARRGADPEFSAATAWGFLAHGWDLAAETFDEPFGRYNRGAPADFVVLEPALHAPVTAGTLREHLARVDGRRVRHVVCAGEVVVRDRACVRVDESAIRTDARDVARQVWATAALPPA